MEGQTHSTAKEHAREHIGDRLRRHHLNELSAAHADGPHGPVLLHPGLHAHANAVDDVEHGDEGNDRQKAVHKDDHGVPHSPHLAVVHAPVREGRPFSAQAADFLHVPLRGVSRKLHVDDGVAVLTCELAKKSLAAVDILHPLLGSHDGEGGEGCDRQLLHAVGGLQGDHIPQLKALVLADVDAHHAVSLFHALYIPLYNALPGPAKLVLLQGDKVDAARPLADPGRQLIGKAPSVDPLYIVLFPKLPGQFF